MVQLLTTARNPLSFPYCCLTQRLWSSLSVQGVVYALEDCIDMKVPQSLPSSSHIEIYLKTKSLQSLSVAEMLRGHVFTTCQSLVSLGCKPNNK